MILDHVAHGAGFFVVVAASFDTQGLGNGDLHMIDVSAIPHRLQQDVGETERHEVLHGLLAEVVIYAEDISLQEYRPDHVVDDGGALTVFANRLLYDDAGTRRYDAFGAKALRQGTEEVGSGGEVVRADAIVGAERGLQVCPSAVSIGVDCDEIEPRKKPLQRRARAAVDEAKLNQCIFDGCAEGLAIKVTTRRANDAGRFGELVAAFAVEQRWIELAMG